MTDEAFEQDLRKDLPRGHAAQSQTAGRERGLFARWLTPGEMTGELWEHNKGTSSRPAGAEDRMAGGAVSAMAATVASGCLLVFRLFAIDHGSASWTKTMRISKPN